MATVPIPRGAGERDLARVTMARLRQRAAYCREMARSARAGGIARELEAIAREYDADADQLQSRRPGTG